MYVLQTEPVSEGDKKRRSVKPPSERGDIPSIRDHLVGVENCPRFSIDMAPWNTNRKLAWLSVRESRDSRHDWLEQAVGMQIQMQQTLLNATPLVVQAVVTVNTQPRDRMRVHELDSALQCLQAWMSVLRGKYEFAREEL